MEKKKKVMWTLPRNIIPANQQQVALVLVHRSNGGGGKWERNLYTPAQSNVLDSGFCEEGVVAGETALFIAWNEM